MTAKNHNNREGTTPQNGVLTPGAGAAMGVGVGAALTATTGDGWWIGLFAAFGAFVAIVLTALHARASRPNPLTMGDQEANQ